MASYIPALRLPLAWAPASRAASCWGALSITATVSGIVTVLFAHATLAVSQSGVPAGTGNPGLADVGFISQTARRTRFS